MTSDSSGSDSLTNTPDTIQPRRGLFDWEQFRFGIAALLLSAAVFKIIDMPQILAGDGLLAAMPRLVALAAFEAAVATYLVVGNRLGSWLLTLTTFLIFVTAAVYAMATDQSCDCFGKQLTPEIIVVVDMVVLLCTGLLPPRGVRMAARSLIRQWTIVAVVGGLIAALAGWRYEVLLRQERSRLLLAELLVGNPWPLNGNTDPSLAELSRGKWMILVAREDCVHCRNLVARHFADPETHRIGERTAVFVFGGSDHRWRYQFDRVALDSSGNELPDWPNGEPYVINPAVFVVDDGIVTDASEGAETDEFLDSLLRDRERTDLH
ncbi:MAG: hypothetical protein R3C17_15885 [Planctomycetaceae bacterium]